MVTNTEIITNWVLLILCYLYIVAIIFIAVRIDHKFPKNLKRKFLHIMIGNFVYVIPFFTFTTFPANFPFFVASPFILLTLSASPASPFNLRNRISGLSDITTGGHQFGLVLYAISYTILAFFFSAKPYVIIAGILPMAFGDAAASLVGQKMGRHQFNIFSKKSIEGTTAMFTITFVSVALSLLIFAYLCPFSTSVLLLASLGVAALATAIEALTPKGLDNLTVPLISALAFLLLVGGI
ncbi:MAG: diacylglycerol/polyprenol kinase family protein [Candidatus Bathyarchaeia archaeon]